MSRINRLVSVAPMMDCTDRHERYFLRLISKLAVNYLTKQKNDFGFPINDVCRFHLKNGADIDDIAINANVSEIGFKRSFGVMVNYRYELAKIEKNHQEYVNEKKVNISNKVKKHV